MKGMAVEVKNNKTVVLADNGEFIKLDHVYNVGETIDIPSRTRISHVRRNLIAACAALMFFLGAGGIYAATTPYSYVTLDVNPSVEYEVNYFNHVIEVKGLNKDGKALAKVINSKEIKGKDVPEAIDATLTVAEDKGYIEKNEDSYAIVSVVSKDDDRTTEISKKVIKHVKKSNNDKLTVDVVVGTMSDRGTAQKLNTSTGKLQVAKELNKSTNKEIMSDKKVEKKIKEAGQKAAGDLVESAKSKQEQSKAAAGDNNVPKTEEQKPVEDNDKTAPPGNIIQPQGDQGGGSHDPNGGDAPQ